MGEPKEIRHAAIMQIGKTTLLRMLKFDGGIVHNIRVDPDVWNPDIIEIVLEHPDLPKVEDGFTLTRITPLYLDEVDDTGQFHKITRIEPPATLASFGL